MPIFRNAMFGFHKEDVYKFITEQSKQYESKIDDLTKEVARKEEEIRKEKEAFKGRNLEYENFRKKRAVLDSFSGEARAAVDRILSDEKQLSACTDLCEDQIKGMLQAISSLETDLKKAELLRGKAEKFDQLSNVLSSILTGDVDNKEFGESPIEDKEPAPNVIRPEADGTEKLRTVLASLSEHCEDLIRLIESAEEAK